MRLTRGEQGISHRLGFMSVGPFLWYLEGQVLRSTNPSEKREKASLKMQEKGILLNLTPHLNFFGVCPFFFYAYFYIVIIL